MNNVPIPGSGGGLIRRDQALLDIINDRISTIAEAPVTGTNAVWGLTIGGTVTGGNIRVRNTETGVATNVLWSATNNTLSNRMNTALDTLFGASNVNAVFTGTSGIGSFAITFSNDLGLQPVEIIEAQNLLTGTAPTVALTNTTPGVRPSGYGTPKGGIIIQEDDGTIYVNKGSATSPNLVEIVAVNSADVVKTLRVPLVAATTTTPGAVCSEENPEGVDLHIIGAVLYSVAGASTPDSTMQISIDSEKDILTDANASSTGYQKMTSNGVLWGSDESLIGTADGTLVGMEAYLHIQYIRA